jgi:hypothetical protein
MGTPASSTTSKTTRRPTPQTRSPRSRTSSNPTVKSTGVRAGHARRDAAPARPHGDAERVGPEVELPQREFETAVDVGVHGRAHRPTRPVLRGENPYLRFGDRRAVRIDRATDEPRAADLGQPIETDERRRFRSFARAYRARVVRRAGGRAPGALGFQASGRDPAGRTSNRRTHLGERVLGQVDLGPFDVPAGDDDPDRFERSDESPASPRVGQAEELRARRSMGSVQTGMRDRFALFVDDVQGDRPAGARLDVADVPDFIEPGRDVDGVRNEDAQPTTARGADVEAAPRRFHGGLVHLDAKEPVFVARSLIARRPPRVGPDQREFRVRRRPTEAVDGTPDDDRNARSGGRFRRTLRTPRARGRSAAVLALFAEAAQRRRARRQAESDADPPQPSVPNRRTVRRPPRRRDRHDRLHGRARRRAHSRDGVGGVAVTGAGRSVSNSFRVRSGDPTRCRAALGARLGAPMRAAGSDVGTRPREPTDVDGAPVADRRRWRAGYRSTSGRAGYRSTSGRTGARRERTRARVPHSTDVEARMSDCGLSPRERLRAVVRRSATTVATRGHSISVCGGTRARVRSRRPRDAYRPSGLSPTRSDPGPDDGRRYAAPRTDRRRGRAGCRPTSRARRLPTDVDGAPATGRRRGAPGAHASPRAALDRRRGAHVRLRTLSARAAARRCPSGPHDGRCARTLHIGLWRHAGSRALPAPARRVPPFRPFADAVRSRSRRRASICSPANRPTSRARRLPTDVDGAPATGRRRGAPGAHASPRAALDRRRGAHVRLRTLAARTAARRCPSGRDDGRCARTRRIGLWRNARTRRIGLWRHAGSRAFPAPLRDACRPSGLSPARSDPAASTRRRRLPRCHGPGPRPRRSGRGASSVRSAARA